MTPVKGQEDCVCVRISALWILYTLSESMCWGAAGFPLDLIPFKVYCCVCKELKRWNTYLTSRLPRFPAEPASPRSWSDCRTHWDSDTVFLSREEMKHFPVSLSLFLSPSLITFQLIGFFFTQKLPEVFLHSACFSYHFLLFTAQREAFSSLTSSLMSLLTSYITT